jgi:hypothetical protein
MTSSAGERSLRVALDCGFAYVSNFNRAFRRAFRTALDRIEAAGSDQARRGPAGSPRLKDAIAKGRPLIAGFGESIVTTPRQGARAGRAEKQ